MVKKHGRKIIFPRGAATGTALQKGTMFLNQRQAHMMPQGSDPLLTLDRDNREGVNSHEQSKAFEEANRIQIDNNFQVVCGEAPSSSNRHLGRQPLSG